MPSAREFAPKRGKSGSVNIIGEELDALVNPRAVFASAESPATLQNPQLLKAPIPSLPDGAYPLRLRADGGFDQLLGGFTVGPPLSGLMLSGIFPAEVPAAGGSTIFLLGNGFLESGRTPAPVVTVSQQAQVPGVTLDNALIEVAGFPSASSVGARRGDIVEVKVTFSDGQALIGAVGYV